MNWYKKIKIAGLPAYSIRDFLKKLKILGMKMERMGAKHNIWINPINGNRSSIPRHKGEINPITMKDILDDLGISLREFKNMKLDPSTIEKPIEDIPEWQKEPWYIEQQKQLQTTSSNK